MLDVRKTSYSIYRCDLQIFHCHLWILFLPHLYLLQKGAQQGGWTLKNGKKEMDCLFLHPLSYFHAKHLPPNKTILTLTWELFRSSPGPNITRLEYQLCPFLALKDSATAMHALLTSNLDTCKPLFFVGLPLEMTPELQLVQNATAHILVGSQQMWLSFWGSCIGSLHSSGLNSKY